MTPSAEPARWVIGRGLLGSAVVDASNSAVLGQPITWQDPNLAHSDLVRGLELLSTSATGRMEIFWCAGRGVTSTPAAQLALEISTFQRFLDAILGLPDDIRARLSVFLASSVGGAYAGSSDPPFDESTPTAPLSDYGRAKLAMEQSLALATERGGWRSFISRITNLYGAGQDMTKGQGLLSVLVASYVTRRPASIYVPLDTLRDYIYADDCARVVLAGTGRVAGEPRGTTVVKIVGAMAAQSVGAILGETRRLNAGRRAPVILGQGSHTGQALDLRVRSQVWTDLDALVRTTLPEGLHRLHAAQLDAYVAAAPRVTRA